MTDMTPKTRLEGQRGHVIHTVPWADIAKHYDKLKEFEPMAGLIKTIAKSPGSTRLFGATSMFQLMVSDCENFREGDSTLCVTYHPKDGIFEFRHRSFSTRDDRKTCPESCAFETFSLFVRIKFGVLL